MASVFCAPPDPRRLPLAAEKKAPNHHLVAHGKGREGAVDGNSEAPAAHNDGERTQVLQVPEGEEDEVDGVVRVQARSAEAVQLLFLERRVPPAVHEDAQVSQPQ